jgi:hypothetical protein
MHRRTCANARVVSYISSTGTAIYIFTGKRILVRDWSPRTNILMYVCRCFPSQPGLPRVVAFPLLLLWCQHVYLVLSQFYERIWLTKSVRSLI